MKCLPFPLPCVRCSSIRRLRADDLCVPCGDAQDASRLKDWKQDHQAEYDAWVAQRMAVAS